MKEPENDWRKIPAAANHEINARGDVRAADGTPKRFWTDAHGRRFVSFYINGVPLNFAVHRMVAAAFLPNPEGLPFVRVIDGDFSRPHVGNLEWTNETRPRPTGEASGNSKLTSDAVVRIRQRIAEGDVLSDIARDFKVHPSLISHIKAGRKWS